MSATPEELKRVLTANPTAPVTFIIRNYTVDGVPPGVEVKLSTESIYCPRPNLFILFPELKKALLERDISVSHIPADDLIAIGKGIASLLEREVSITRLHGGICLNNGEDRHGPFTP